MISLAPQYCNVPFTPSEAKKLWATFESLAPSPAIRHQLSDQENSLSREVLKDTFTALKDKFDEMASRPDATFEQAKDLIAKSFYQGITEDPRILSHEKNATVKNPDYALKACINRDATSASYELQMAFINAARTAPRNRTTPAANVNLDQATFGKQFKGEIQDALDLVNNLFKGKQPTQDDLDRKAQAISLRFGLDGFSIGNEQGLCSRQRMQWMKKTESQLQESCRRLGIEEFSFGREGGISFGIITPQSARTRGIAGCFSGNNWPGSSIQFNPCSQAGSSILVHEFTHALDYDLGCKALKMSEQAGNDLSGRRGRHNFFSGLDAADQSFLPKAKEGLTDVFGVLSSTPLSTQFKMKMEALNSPLINPGQQVRTQSETSAVLKEYDDRLNRLADKFLLKTLGEEGAMSLSKKDMKLLRKDLEADDSFLLRNLSTLAHLAESDAGLNTVLNDYSEKHKTEHPFFTRLQTINSVNKFEAMTKALYDCTPELAAVSAMTHSTRINVKPSEMLENSIRVDIERVQSGISPAYNSLPHELLARVIGRPHGPLALARDMCREGWQTLVSGAQIKSLNSGLRSMLESSGFQATASGPDVSMGFENTTNIVNRAIGIPVGSLSGNLKKLSGQLGFNLVNKLMDHSTSKTPEARCGSAKMPP